MKEFLQNARLDLTLQFRDDDIFGNFDFVDQSLSVTAIPFPEGFVESFFVEI